MDYYDYGPRVMLERPIALVGFMGSGARQVAHGMSATLGLPLYDVDRWVEHEAGCSLAVLHLLQGEAARRTVERRMVERALNQNAPGVLALGDGALMDSQSRSRLLGSATVVFIDRPVGALRSGLERELDQEPSRFPEFALSGLPDNDDLFEQLVEHRRRDYLAADHRVNAGRLHPRQVAKMVVQRLSLLE